MSRTTRIAEAVARHLAGKRLDVVSVTTAFAAVLGRRYRIAQEVAARLVARFGHGRRLTSRRVEQSLLGDASFVLACKQRVFPRLNLNLITDAAPQMQPAGGVTWQVPPILTESDLAAWLGVDFSRLLWFADPRTLEGRLPEGPLRHYRYRWVLKRSGGARLIESPKPRLSVIQRQILHQILDAIPPHPAAHGFCRGRSTLSFASPHLGQPMVLRMDLSDFFPTIGRARITSLFMTAGYPDSVAALLANLCVNTTPFDVARNIPDGVQVSNQWALRKMYQRPHLPQGAPTSPALANLCAFRLDCRLSALATACGANYTRYADDLAFSGGTEFRRSVERFHIRAAAIAMEEGFNPNLRKTRFMPGARSQRIAGLVVNTKLNTSRGDYDVLKAILHNCARLGPASQNRAAHPDFRAHLAGRISHVTRVNPQRGEKLRLVFERIVWEI